MSWKQRCSPAVSSGERDGPPLRLAGTPEQTGPQVMEKQQHRLTAAIILLPLSGIYFEGELMKN